nr:hypothetical protein [Kibdelosporangium sp. MJ126-NF4]
MGGLQDFPPYPVGSQWFVLIEENVGWQQGTRWMLTHATSYPNRDAALASAVWATKWYKPENPRSEQHRTAYRSGEDVWTIQVQGAFSSFHFRVSLAQLAT